MLYIIHYQSLIAGRPHQATALESDDGTSETLREGDGRAEDSARANCGQDKKRNRAAIGRVFPCFPRSARLFCSACEPRARERWATFGWR